MLIKYLLLVYSEKIKAIKSCDEEKLSLKISKQYILMSNESSHHYVMTKST